MNRKYMGNTTSFRMDLSKSGFDMFFKPYMKKGLEVLWEHPEGLSTRRVWSACNGEMDKSISRASVINFLAWAAEEDILEYREETGKGGYRRIYSHIYDKDGLSNFLKLRVREALASL
jgi:hypothetical protein